MTLSSAGVSIFEENEVDTLPLIEARAQRRVKARALSPQKIQEKISGRISALGALRKADTRENESGNTSERAINNQLRRSGLDSLLNFPKNPKPLVLTSTFSPLQEWEGYVRRVTNYGFNADLVNISAGKKRVSEQAKIPFSELTEDDAAKVRPGAVFRWTIGYQRSAAGTKTRASTIVFRDLPKWTAKDFREAKEEAADLKAYFDAGKTAEPPSGG